MNSSLIIGSIFLSSFFPQNKEILLIPGGDNIVFDLKTDGLIVTGSYDIRINNENYNPFINNDIKKGDVIVEVNNQKTFTLSEFSKVVENSKQNILELKLNREGKEINRLIKVVYEENKLKTGLYVKNDIYGVGTISFINPNNKTYGALGHEVYDECSHQNIISNNGLIYLEDVTKINKGKNNYPGSKESEITLKNKIGNIKKSNIFGLFGSYNLDISNRKALKLATFEEIKKDEAYIRTCTKGNKIKDYKIKILDKNNNRVSSTKSLYFEVIDEELISKAGGVYSGMSGSPIIQNNKLIGVVTHVINSSIKNGYGLYIDTMYKNSLY